MKHYMALFFSLASLTAHGSDYSEGDYSDSEYNGRDSGLSAQSAHVLAKFETQRDHSAQWTQRQVKNAARHKRNDMARSLSATALEADELQQDRDTQSRSVSPKKGSRTRTTSDTAQTSSSPLPFVVVRGKSSARTLAIAARRASDAKVRQ